MFELFTRGRHKVKRWWESPLGSKCWWGQGPWFKSQSASSCSYPQPSIMVSFWNAMALGDGCQFGNSFGVAAQEGPERHGQDRKPFLLGIFCFLLQCLLIFSAQGSSGRLADPAGWLWWFPLMGEHSIHRVHPVFFTFATGK